VDTHPTFHEKAAAQKGPAPAKKVEKKEEPKADSMWGGHDDFWTGDYHDRHPLPGHMADYGVHSHLYDHTRHEAPLHHQSDVYKMMLQ
jgi:hypothetical protein